MNKSKKLLICCKGDFNNGKKTLTTGDVAKICDVTPETVAHWIDKGELRGFYLPGGKTRRVIRANLIEFMKRNHIPIEIKEEIMCDYM